MSRERKELEEIGKRVKREIDASPTYKVVNNTGSGNYNGQMMIGGRRGQVVSPAGVGGVLNTVTPCAACKLLRRRCAEECPFSPYFSPHEPQKFAAVHKVFGASNVSKMLLEVSETQRADTANSLVYEANVRLRDPIYGCMGAISSLQRQVQTLQAQLNLVRGEIFKFKFREVAASTSINPNSILSAATHHASLGPSQPPTTPPTSSTSPSASNLYTPQPPSSTTGAFSSISSDSVAYFD